MAEKNNVIEWTSNLSVEEDMIDSQHNALLSQINKLYNEFMKGEEESAIQSSILFLDTYIRDHLAYEEKYMKEHAYPGLTEHKRIHVEFIRSYEKFKKELIESNFSSDLAIRIQKFLGGWWLDHIAVIDHKYAEYIKEHNGVK